MRRSKLTFALSVPLACATLALTGCAIGTLIGGMARSAELHGTSDIPAEYTGLQDKSFAVVVSADRLIQATEPGLTARITQRVNNRLMQNAGASFGIPSNDLLAVLYAKPQWHAMQPSEVADILGVERLVWVEVDEYRLTEPGNQYIWAGVASGLVFVYAADGLLPDDPMFEKRIHVEFPDSQGYMQSDIPAGAVTSELSNRFINRVSWLFYDHEEPNMIEY